MIVLPEKARDAAILALEKLARRTDLPQDVQMELQITAGVLGYARHVDEAGAAVIAGQSGKIIDLLDQLAGALQAHCAPETLRHAISGLRTDAQGLSRQDAGDSQPQQRFAQFLRALDWLLIDLEREIPEAAQAFLTQSIAPLLQWQRELNALSQVPELEAAPLAQTTSVNVEDMQALLRVRMGDASLTVTDWTVLTGGFGKETCLFQVTGNEVNAELVMRRDVAPGLIAGVDCHEVKQEFPLLKAVFELGFSVPEPLLLETVSRAVAGPDFMIVRRVPGRVEGNQFGAEGKVAVDIQRELARVSARLHQLPPMRSLGDAHEGSRELRAELWDMSMADCVRDYIGAWYRLYLSRPHMAIPAVHGMFQWLQSHVQETQERPVLVHGDIGLHNLLFHEGKLSSVLDWEFAHVGDPAEDLGIIYTVMGKTLDWESFLEESRRTGQPLPSSQRIRYFEIWMNFRNLCIASMCLELFASGELPQIRYGIFATRFIPYYIEQVSTLIGEWPAGQ